MVLPTTYMAVLWLLIASALCFGSWANLQKLTGKWRFELFYYDYSFGVALCAILAAFTLGSMLSRELTFQDNLLIASRRQMAYSAAAGVVLNLGNILTIASLSVSGLALAFPVSMGMAVLTGLVFTVTGSPLNSPVLLFGGAFVVLVAMIFNALSRSLHLDAQVVVAAPKPRGRPPGTARAVFLAVMGGIFLGLGWQLVEMGRVGDAGVAPYGEALWIGAGVFLSTLFYAPFFMTFPPGGRPIGWRDYFQGTKSRHALGVLAGMAWLAAAIAALLGAGAAQAAQLPAGAGYLMAQGAPLLSALWGLLAWREFKGAKPAVNLLLAAMLVLYAAGLWMIALAQPQAR